MNFTPMPLLKAALPELGADDGKAYSLDTVFRNHASDVARWARALMGPEGEIDDVVQEVFLVVQRRLGEFNGDAKISTWLFEITRRVVQARRRRWYGWFQRHLNIEDRQDDMAHPGDPVGESIERQAAQKAVYQILDKLPEKYRTALVLHEMEELDGAAIAQLTGTTVQNVWVRLHRARQLFAKHFRAWERTTGGGA